MIEIARVSGWLESHRLFTHILILPMSMRAGAITAAAARFQKNAGMTAMKWREGPSAERRTKSQDPRSP